MNREPSVTIRIPRGQFSGFPKRSNPQLWQAMFAAAREAFGPDISGLVHVSTDRAYFEKTGVNALYSMLLTETELAHFHPAVTP